MGLPPGCDADSDEIVRGARLAFERTSCSRRGSESSEVEEFGKAASLGYLDLDGGSGRDPSESFQVIDLLQ